MKPCRVHQVTLIFAPPTRQISLTFPADLPKGKP